MIKMVRTYVIRKALFVASLLGAQMLNAQNQMRIHYKDGTRGDVPIAQIDSITFVDDEGGEGEEMQVKELTGSYGFDTMTYGYYSVYGAMLNMWSNGFGYQHRYNWFITALTDNALGVMTKMGPFTYYKLQPEVIRLKVNESLTCTDGDSFVFADGVVVSIEDNKLRGVAVGETYIQKLKATSKQIVSYKVVVEG